eukprot:846558-Pyramimonas_sp.AAC.1
MGDVLDSHHFAGDGIPEVDPTADRIQHLLPLGFLLRPRGLVGLLCADSLFRLCFRFRGGGVIR